MNERQLKAIIGCTLVQDNGDELIIIELNPSSLSLVVQEGKKMEISIESFVNHYSPNLRLYLTDCEDSLVPIVRYLEHFDIK